VASGKTPLQETPQQLSRESIEEFKAVYQEEFGEILSDDEVRDIGQGSMMATLDKRTVPTIHDLYPHFTEKELAEAEDNLERYLMLVLRIFERRELQKAEQLTEDTDALSSQIVRISVLSRRLFQLQ
jgi:hypothetical protein